MHQLRNIAYIHKSFVLKFQTDISSSFWVMSFFCKKMPLFWVKLSRLMSRFWELYFSAAMILRSLKFTLSIAMTFLSRVLNFLISIFNCFSIMKAFVKKVIFAHDIFWKITLMTVALGKIWNYKFFLLFPLYFFEIYNFELIIIFRFRLPYTDSGNPFSLCKNLWAYSMEGI